MTKQKKVRNYLLLFVGMYLITFLLLAVLAFVLWKNDGNPAIMSGGLIGIYTLVSGAGGFFAGKMMGVHKFLWGFFTGLLFFLMHLGIGVMVFDTPVAGNQAVFNGAMLCVVSGMLGGMFAPVNEKNTQLK